MARPLMITVLLASLVAGCGKSDQNSESADPKAPAAKTTTGAESTSAACAAKTKELEPWLAQLETETASHEIEMGSVLPTIERAPIPLSRTSDWIVVGASLAAYDATVRSVSGSDAPLARTSKAIVERLTQMRATPPPADEGDAAPADQLRINIDEKTPWSDVVLVADAAAKAGYTEALFAFGATSKLRAPTGVAETTTSADAASQASRALEGMQETCKPWGRAVLRHTFNPDRAENAKAVARETAAALAECNCVADPDELKKLWWQRARWHQAKLRTRVIVKLGGEDAISIALPAKTPWSDAHVEVVEAAPEGASPPVATFVAK